MRAGGSQKRPQRNPKARGRSGLTYAVQARLTEHQGEAIRARALRLDVAESVAMRELLDRGLILDASERHGLVVTEAAAELLGPLYLGGSLIRFSAGVIEPPADALLAVVDDAMLDALRSGAMLVSTPEELDAINAEIAER